MTHPTQRPATLRLIVLALAMCWLMAACGPLPALLTAVAPQASSTAAAPTFGALLLPTATPNAWAAASGGLPTLRPGLTPAHGLPLVGAPGPLPPSCAFQPLGDFGQVLYRAPQIVADVGCPLALAYQTDVVTQAFEGGWMLWLSVEDPHYIYVFISNRNDFVRYADVFVEGGTPAPLLATPAPAGRIAPQRGFGALWAAQPQVRAALGWALNGEQLANGAAQDFDGGMMISARSLNMTLWLHFTAPDGGAFNSFMGVSG
jgi:hypothetical protein